MTNSVQIPSGCLSVVIPAFNEESTILACLDSVLEQDFVGEVVVVNDCSTDGTTEVLENISDIRVKVIHHEINQGKGAALRSGFKNVTGQYIAIQDADLEYDPKDLRKLLGPLCSGDADVVYGSRFLTGDAHRVLYYWHSVGNKFLTFLSNAATNLNLTDMETCYKVFRKEVIDSINVEENRFGFEPEITAKIAAARWRVYEVGISYRGRTYDEGKKIGWKDGVHALRCIAYYSVRERRRNKT